jgi:hypothetical protein
MLLSPDLPARSTYSDRKKKVVVPTFNSYVFVQIADSDRSFSVSVSGCLLFVLVGQACCCS